MNKQYQGIAAAGKIGNAAKHDPKFHESGWCIAVETPRGVIGLWSCWLNDRFYLGYPKSFTDRTAIEELIVKTLGVDYAKPVLHVSGVVVSEGYEGECKDPDKPIETNSDGQSVAYKTYGLRLWAKFYGPRIEGKEGRLWVDHSDSRSCGYLFFPLIRDGGIETISFGYDYSMSIESFPFDFANQYAPDGPTTDPEVMQPYRDSFLHLLCEIAKVMGGASAVHIKYGFVAVPEQLKSLGYDRVDWLKGTPSTSHGLGKKVVRAEKDGEVLVLESGNNIIPWAAIRRSTPATEMTVEYLLGLLTS